MCFFGGQKAASAAHSMNVCETLLRLEPRITTRKYVSLYRSKDLKFLACFTRANTKMENAWFFRQDLLFRTEEWWSILPLIADLSELASAMD